VRFTSSQSNSVTGDSNNSIQETSNENLGKMSCIKKIWQIQTKEMLKTKTLVNSSDQTTAIKPQLQVEEIIN